MNTLKEIAIEAFNLGSDNFGEKVTGVSDDLNFSKLYNTNLFKQKHYTKTVFLEQTDGHPCTSSIGFYVKNNGVMEVCSGHIVFKIPLSPELEEELKNCTETEI